MTFASQSGRSDRGDAWRRRAMTLSLDADASRGARFSKRLSEPAKPSASMGYMRLLPGWLGWNDSDRLQLAQATALVAHRRTLDREISGARLSLVADHVGERLFEEICDIDIPTPLAADGSPLPAPEKLADEGELFLRASLPAGLSAIFPGAAGDRSAEAVVNLAQQCVAVARIVDLPADAAPEAEHGS